MIDIAREVARVRYPVLVVSGLAWIALFAGAPGFHMHLHTAAQGGGMAIVAPSFSMFVAVNSPAAIAAAWTLMVVAMMLPLVIPAIHHVRFNSLARRRPRSIALFAAGYAAVWMACGAVFTGLEFTASVFAPWSYIPAAALAVIASVWQASPFKQRCLNRCHAAPPLAAFGREADLDSLRFGLTHGLWCAGSCWALMLFPMLLPGGHLAAMAAVAILIFCERLEDPEPPRWKLRGLGKASRIVAARTRIRLRILRRDLSAFS
jgi:predicted metal-binding membrane protein